MQPTFDGPTMRVTIAFLTVVLLSVCGSCHAQKPPKIGQANVPPNLLASLQAGMAQDRVEEVLSARGDHQFTALISTNVVRCVSYYRNDVFGEYYLVFTNNHLSSICEPPAFEMRRVRYNDSWLNERVAGDPEGRISKVLAATNMLGPTLVAALKPQTPPKRSTDPGLTAAFLLAQRSVDKAKQAQREKEYLVLLEKFDPTKVELGATVAEVEKRLGKPRIVETLETGDEKRYYGSVEFGLMASREMMWLTIVCREDKVIRVFSHDFLDQSKIKALEEKAK